MGVDVQIHPRIVWQKGSGRANRLRPFFEAGTRLFSRIRGRRVRNLKSYLGFVWRDLDVPLKDCAFIELECRCLEIADQSSGSLQLARIIDGDISVDFPVNNDGAGHNIALDLGVAFQDEISLGNNIAAYPAIEGEFVAKLDRSFDFDVF
jgi:hypothetical protein